MDEGVKSGKKGPAAGNGRDDVYLLGDVDDLRSVLNHLNAGVVAHGADTRIRVCNPMACEILGLTMNQMIGVAVPDPKWKFLREDGSDMPLDEYPVSVVLKTRSVLRNLVVGVNRPASNDFAWALCNGFPVLDDQGELQLAIITFIDITSLKQIEKELRISEANYREIFDAATDMIVVQDIQTGAMLDVNAETARATGYTHDELLEMGVEGFSPEGEEYSPEMIIGHVSRAAAGESQLFEWGFVDKAGDLHPTEVHLQRVTIGGESRLLGVVRDITERKQAEEERESLEVQLRHALKMEAIGRLAGGVAHDFNNILTGITGYSELVLSSLGPEHPLHAEVEEIRKASERAAELTSQLLSFARKQIIDPRVIQPNEILSRSEKMLRRLIGEDVDLVFKPGENLRNIRSDPGQIDQILVNLAVNARDAMPDGGRLTIETANVTLENEPNPVQDKPTSGEFVMIAISDDGAGMDAATRERIFEPFFSTKATGEGTGLGLSTVYGIVKQNGGFLNVYSEPGRGTTFKIYLTPATEDPDPSQREYSTDVPDGTETVLLVEDDGVVRELARRILSSHGYTVLEAGEGNEAGLLSRRYSGTIHLLLTDVVMPDVNGRELFERLKAERPGLTALFMSGYTENVIAHHGVLDRGTHFIQKPFTVKSLARSVRDVLDGIH